MKKLLEIRIRLSLHFFVSESLSHQEIIDNLPGNHETNNTIVRTDRVWNTYEIPISVECSTTGVPMINTRIDFIYWILIPRDLSFCSSDCLPSDSRISIYDNRLSYGNRFLYIRVQVNWHRCEIYTWFQKSKISDRIIGKQVRCSIAFRSSLIIIRGTDFIESCRLFSI